jgi:transaldolase/glucose-6-phosphate isomerase
VEQLHQCGQSVWLDYIRRSLVTSGELARLRDLGVRGMTSNPSIFEKAISGSTDYDESIRALAARGGCDPYDAFVSIATEDIQMAADVFRPVFEASGGEDGFVSLEAPPGIEHDRDATIAEVKRLFALLDRPNVMVKVPGTLAGVEALEVLTAEGINVNVTLLFAVPMYERVIEAYIAGIERRMAAGQPVKGISSVASFFVSRIDTKADKILPEDSPLRSKVAIANAWEAYGRFQQRFSGERWHRLAAAGAWVQRPLWASTSTKNPAYSDVLYVEELVAPQTVNTMPESTLRAFLEHGQVAPRVEQAVRAAPGTLARAAEEGVDLDRVTAELLDEGLAAFAVDFEKLLKRLEEAIRPGGERPRRWGATLHGLERRVEVGLDNLARQQVVRRTWERDHTVWKPEPTEIANRLGWLTVAERMNEEGARLRQFADSLLDEGYRKAVLFGMGGSSLAPQVFESTFGNDARGLDTEVLDTTDPATIQRVEQGLDFERTLFIVASKSGSTIETLSHFAYFWDRIGDGRAFIAITDPGSPLETLAREHDFRRVFSNPPEIGGRYSALSYFGLVPAALVGVDLDRLLDSAHEMAHACHSCVSPAQNPGAWLGTVIGQAALAGRDKLTLVLPPEVATFGAWVEQLLAESTGKESRGIIPIEGEPLGRPDAYGEDRIFAGLVGDPQLAELEATQPVLRLALRDSYHLGGEFFRWEFATAIAGHVLGINPFDQPNVEEAKDATARILREGGGKLEPVSLSSLLHNIRAGDYIALQAYLPQSEALDKELQAARVRLRDRYRVATTVGYGPRFLHSTGQMHKGGPNTGVFIQLVEDDEVDLPVPGKPYTFGQLKQAQALGDLESLLRHGRRATRVSVSELLEAVGR